MNLSKETYLQIEELQRENLELKQKLQITDSELHQLKQNEDKFQYVFEASPNGFILVNANGNITLVNEKTESMFGYSRDELVGQKIELLIPMAHRHNHEHYRDEFFKNPVTRSMGAGRDLFGLHKNGSQIPVEIGLNPMLHLKVLS